MAAVNTEKSQNTARIKIAFLLQKKHFSLTNPCDIGKFLAIENH